jgi:hypothetical protein
MGRAAIPDDRLLDDADETPETEDRPPEEETDVPGGRHTSSPGRITRSSDAPFTDSNVDNDTPARVAIAHQLSPDSATYVGAFDGEHDDDGAAPAGKHTTSPGWIASSADESLISSNDRIDTCAP